jgi:hypothetical protein
MKRFGIFSVIMMCVLMIAFVTCENNTGSNNNEIDEPDNQPAIIGTSTYIAAKPSKGFNYGYYYYIPESIKNVSKKFLWVEPNNQPGVSDDIKLSDDEAQNLINGNKPIADELGVVLLVPVFPRPQSGNLGNTLSLNRATLQNSTGNLARINLQLIQMIADLREICGNKGINVAPKVLMTGFSASGKFVNRFTAIHPELVQAVASGGSDPILPIDTLEGERLIYPVGISDLKEITGNPFSLQNFITIPKFIYIGSADENDPLPNNDMFGIEERRIITKVLGSGVHERWGRVRQVYEELDPFARFVVYDGVGHTITNTMQRDILEFFRSNMK